jgi:nucleotide-binding universal stress UspA family protein
MNFKKILIAVDESSSAEKAVQRGFALARKLSAEVLLVSVIDPSATAGNPDAGIFPDDALARARDKTKSLLTKLKNKYDKKVKTELAYPMGELRETVIEAAKKWHADIIVTGTHNASGVSGLFSENTGNSILHHSPVPVLVVPKDS